MSADNVDAERARLQAILDKYGVGIDLHEHAAYVQLGEHISELLFNDLNILHVCRRFPSHNISCSADASESIDVDASESGGVGASESVDSS